MKRAADQNARLDLRPFVQQAHDRLSASTRGLPMHFAATLHETYDFGDAFRTVDGIATSAAGEKMAWLKDPEANLVSIGAH